MQNILIIDDDTGIRELLAKALKKFEFNIYEAAETEEAEVLLKQHQVDLIILDIMMPHEDGFSFCRRMMSKINIPIIMISANDDEIEQIVAHEIGAIDYLVKPFDPRLLVAKIKSIFLHYNQQKDLSLKTQYNKFYFCNWSLDTQTRMLYNEKNNIEVSLSNTEYKLLVTFLIKPQTALSREYLLETIHKRTFDVFDRSIDIAVHRLRKKINISDTDANDGESLIKTIYSGGYLFLPEVKNN